MSLKKDLTKYIYDDPLRQKPPSAAQLEQEAKAEEARQQQVSSLLDSFTRASEPLGTKTSEAKTQVKLT